MKMKVGKEVFTYQLIVVAAAVVVGVVVSGTGGGCLIDGDKL